MNFEHEFFEDEVRDGFFVPAEIKHAWAAELEVLSEVDRICKKYNINYYADWGTLLATVRHEGFIPWDDDLDIVMKREDYKKFLEVAPDEMLPGYSVYNYSNHDDFWLFLARVVGKQRICFEDDHLRRFHEFPYIAGVDIFVLDYVSRDEEAESERDKLALYIIALADHIGDDRCEDKVVRNWLHILEQKCNIFVPYMENRSELRRHLYGVAELLFARFSNEESDSLSQLFPFGLKNKNSKVPKKYYEEAIELSYENTTIPVPLRYCEMLGKKYGDYMKLVRNVGGHDYPFFESQKKQLQSVLDFDMPAYKFDYSQLRHGEQELYYGYKAQIYKRLNDILSKYEKLCDEYNCTDKSVNADNVNLILQESQQAAIDMGTVIEYMKGEDSYIVKKIEDYCELLYEQSTDISRTDIINKLGESVHHIEESVRKDILDRKEAVFVVYKENQLKYIRKVYDEYKSMYDTDCYILVVPYYYKRYDGSYICEEYELNKIKNSYNLSSIAEYNTFDIQLHHPDVIYIQNPYDEWNATITLPKEYYSRNLRDRTRKLVYIPPFVLEEFTKESEREYYNMQYYCTVPGVVYSDEVYVQSDNMRELYIEKLCEFAGETTRHIWLSKIMVDEGIYNTALEADNNKSVLNINSKKKKIAFYIQVGILVQYDSDMLDKMQRVMSVFEAYKDSIEIVWILDDVQEKYLNNAASYKVLCDGYMRIKEQYNNMNIGKTVRKKDISIGEIVKECDAYYGCESHIALEFSQKKKPVMILSVDC